MTDELSIEGKQYISSKRAADLSGYAQDYVGQLARKGLIDAQRIGGLWYVFMDSLLKYKERAETYIPQPPQAIYKNESPDTLISFDGKDYVSAARAAEITGYHQDYVGQLARSSKILSRQVGNRWYVEREGILAHKEEKDDLLGAVQSQAVGIKAPDPIPESYVKKNETWEPLNYRNDSGALIPELSPREHDVADEPIDSSEQVKQTPIPIRVLVNRQASRIVTKSEIKKRRSNSTRISGKSIFYGLLIIIIFAFILAFSSGLFSSLSKAGNSDQKNQRHGAIEILTSVMAKIGDTIEPFVSKQLDYTRI